MPRLLRSNEPASGSPSYVSALALLLALSASPAWAWDATVRADKKRAGANTELMVGGDGRANGACAPTLSPSLPFTISVDGVRLSDGKTHTIADSQRCADKALARADVHVRYDSLASEPRLNILAAPDAVNKGDTLVFATSANYHRWLARGEVRVFSADKTQRQHPIAVIPVEKGGARWQVPSELKDEVLYVLRVYDANGRFDETTPKTAKLADLRGGKWVGDDLLKVFDGNARAVRNIPVTGGAVLVSGTNVPPDQDVFVMGIPVPVDAKGSFAIRHLVAPGTHEVEVAFVDKKGTAASFSRSVTIPDNDLFYVVMADVTAGRDSVNGPAGVIRAEDKDGYSKEAYVNGRVAFYLKGKVKGEYLITASADTKDQPLGSLFSGFDSKDPRHLLRKLDPNKYYPVYGDDSTLVEDAPTRGKLYVRVDRGDSNVMWGNFKTTITGTEFVRYDRGLYGARGQFVSEGATGHGERTTRAEVFAAEPGTIPGRDVFRGTGGSLYYLRRQNITMGSERVAVEIRDRDTGLVVRSKILVPSQDYEINYLQGRIVLKGPLASTAADDFIIQSGSLSGYEQYLVTTYEYAPTLEANKDRAAGGRATHWVNDNLQLGVTGYDQNGAGRHQRIVGTDVTVRATPGTYVKAEIARSNGPGDGETFSLDGGFSFVTRQSDGRTAYARRVEAAADLSELWTGREGRLSAYWQHKDRDFSAPGQITTQRAATEIGARSLVKLTERWANKSLVTEKTDEFRTYRAAETNVVHTFTEHWKATVGARLDDQTLRQLSASPTLNTFGRRTDVALRFDYDSKQDWTAYVFGQKTVARTGTRLENDRIGVGGTKRINERFTALGEVSTGDGGLGGKIGTEYKVNDEQTLYLNYVLDPDRTDILSRGGEGVLVAGARRRFSDSVTVFGEERYRHGGGFVGLTHAYGLDLVPWQHWKTGLTVESGKLSNPYAGDLDRLAASGSIGYAHAGLTYSGKLEYRHDEAPTRERETWLLYSSIAQRMSEDWRLLAKFNTSINTKTVGDYVDGNFTEFVTGAAYRPVAHDRLNALAKYTYFEDVPSPAQRLPNGSTLGYAQRSHVGSIDVAYDLFPWLTVGGKYAIRIGELRDREGAGEWFDAKAQLAILRLDFKVIKEWDLLAEVRTLDSSTAADRKTGALLGVYKHINDNFRIGGGYNFTDYSDNITDLSNRSRGVFINGLAKF